MRNLTSFLARYARRLRRTRYGEEIWDLYERGEWFMPDTFPHGALPQPRPPEYEMTPGARSTLMQLRSTVLPASCSTTWAIIPGVRATSTS